MMTNNDFNKTTFDKGAVFYREGKFKDAISVWEKIANHDVKSARALTSCYSRPDYNPDLQSFVKWLKVLAYQQKDGWGMMILGMLYCGTDHTMWYNTFSAEEISIHRNEDEGLKLMEEGVRLMEGGLCDRKIDYRDYSQIGQTYKNRFDRRKSSMIDLLRDLMYTKKSLEITPDDEYESKKLTEKTIYHQTEHINAIRQVKFNSGTTLANLDVDD